jgi:hypothetical protein
MAAPTFSNLKATAYSTGPTSSYVDIEWAAGSTAVTSSIKYQVVGSGSWSAPQINSTLASGQHSERINGLLPGTRYTFEIIVTNSGGATALAMVSSTTPVWVFQVPFITNVQVTYLTYLGALRTVFTWDTDIPANLLFQLNAGPIIRQDIYTLTHSVTDDTIALGDSFSFELGGLSIYNINASNESIRYYHQAPSTLPTAGRPKIYSIAAQLNFSSPTPGKQSVKIEFLTDLACDTSIKIINKITNTEVLNYYTAGYVTDHIVNYEPVDYNTAYRIYVSGNNSNPAYGLPNAGLWVDINTFAPPARAYVRPPTPALPISSNLELVKKIDSYFRFGYGDNSISVSGILDSGYFKYDMQIKDGLFNNIPYNSTYINPHFPALRSGHRLFQRPSLGKQFPSIK